MIIRINIQSLETGASLSYGLGCSTANRKWKNGRNCIKFIRCIRFLKIYVIVTSVYNIFYWVLGSNRQSSLVFRPHSLFGWCFWYNFTAKADKIYIFLLEINVQHIFKGFKHFLFDDWIIIYGWTWVSVGAALITQHVLALSTLYQNP